MDKQTIKAVVFDMDGVIIDTEKMYLDCWLEIGKEYGLSDMDKPALASIGVTWEGTKQLMVDFYGEDLPIEDMAEDYLALAESRFMDKKVDLKPGIKELLDALKEHDYKLAVASSSDRDLVVAILSYYNLIDYFEHLTCGDEVKRSKPDPDIYLSACRSLSIAPDQAIAIEDSFNGIRSAKAAGMYPIMVPDLIQPDEEMEDKAEMILKDLNCVREWLLG